MSQDTHKKENLPIHRLKPRGHFSIVCKDEKGNVKWKEEFWNLITTNGFDFVLDAIFQSTSRPGIMSHVAIGSGTTAAAVGDTALGSELARVAGTYAHTDDTLIATLTGEFAAGTGTGTVAEVGVLNAASGGTMLARALLGTPRTKAALDSMTVTYTLTLSQQ